MNPKEFEQLYMGKFEPHPYELLSTIELSRIEKDKFADRENRRLARKIRIEREERNAAPRTKRPESRGRNDT